MKFTTALLSLLASTSSASAFVIPQLVSNQHHVSSTLLTAQDPHSQHSRRNFLSVGSFAPLVLAASPSTASSASTSGPIADLPMIRLSLPKQAVGRSYVVVQLMIDDQGPFDFMVDSGLTTEMITPHLASSLGLKPGSSVVRGLSAGGESAEGLVELKGLSLCCGTAGAKGKDLNIPSLNAVITDFPQERIDPKHDVEGMLGMELLDLFDVDFDFPKNRMRLWSPGTVAGEAGRAGMVTIPDAVLNETGLLGMRVTSTDASSKQPLIGLLDCGASFSVCNWAAAKYLGLPPRDDAKAYSNSPTIMGIGIDGKPLLLPTHDVQFTFVGDASKDPSTGQVVFESPPSSWKPFDSVTVGIGDLPVFSQLLGDGRTPYTGPAVLIGLDVLSQRRVILETGRGRSRKMYVDPR